MSEQSDWIAEQEKIALSKELERFIVKATAKNTRLMIAKMGGNITFNEHLIIQRTLQVAKACLPATEAAQTTTQERELTTLTDSELERIASGS